LSRDSQSGNDGGVFETHDEIDMKVAVVGRVIV
jgi:hypothetical protein